MSKGLTHQQNWHTNKRAPALKYLYRIIPIHSVHLLFIGFSSLVSYVVFVLASISRDPCFTASHIFPHPNWLNSALNVNNNATSASDKIGRTCEGKWGSCWFKCSLHTLYISRATNQQCQRFRHTHTHACESLSTSTMTTLWYTRNIFSPPKVQTHMHPLCSLFEIDVGFISNQGGNFHNTAILTHNLGWRLGEDRPMYVHSTPKLLQVCWRIIILSIQHLPFP